MKGEIVPMLAGGLIRFLSSIGTNLVNGIIKKAGKVEIYYKVVHAKGTHGGTWGFYRAGDYIIFQIPMWVQFKNTSNSSKVIRNFNILLFNGGRQIGEMVQITNNSLGETYGDEGVYSFVLEAQSIEQYEFHFAAKKRNADHEFEFDEVRFRYFDDKDRIRILQLSRIDHCWKLGAMERTPGWSLAKARTFFR